MKCKLLHKMGQKAKFCQEPILFMLLKIDLIDSWAEIKILIVAHNLPIEKWNFD